MTGFVQMNYNVVCNKNWPNKSNDDSVTMLSSKVGGVKNSFNPFLVKFYYLDDQDDDQDQDQSTLC